MDPDVRTGRFVVSPAGSRLASFADATIRLWAGDSFTTLTQPSGKERHVRSLGFPPDGETLASGDAGGTLNLWTMR